MKTVKPKLFALLLFILCTALLSAANANAAVQMTPTEIPELSLTIDLPAEAKTILSPVKKNDPIFSNGTFDYITIMTKMRSDNALLYGKSTDYEIEIISPEKEAKIKNLSSLSLKKKESAMEDFSTQSDVNDCKIYESENASFFELSRTSNGVEGRFFYYEFTTIYNSRYITIRIISENDYINNSEKEIAKAMADSIVFPQKKSVSLSEFPMGRITFALVLCVFAYVLVIVYRRDEERYNTLFVGMLQKYVNKPEKHDEQTQSETLTQDNKTETTTDEDPEDEDLSAVDLDDAIAFFDDNSSGT